MQVMINGETVTMEARQLSVAHLLTLKKVESPDMVSVQLNGRIVDRHLYEEQLVGPGDEVEFLYFMGGGAFR